MAETPASGGGAQLEVNPSIITASVAHRLHLLSTSPPVTRLSSSVL